MQITTTMIVCCRSHFPPLPKIHQNSSTFPVIPLNDEDQGGHMNILTKVINKAALLSLQSASLHCASKRLYSWPRTFHKVVWQQNFEGRWWFQCHLSPQIFSEFNSEKSYENWSTFAGVIVKIKLAHYCTERHGVYQQWKAK